VQPNWPIRVELEDSATQFVCIVALLCVYRLNIVEPNHIIIELDKQILAQHTLLKASRAREGWEKCLNLAHTP
jgi:hypothetical protein